MRKTLECKDCSCEVTLEFNYDEVGEDPIFCPFCGSSYIEEELDEMEYPHNDMDDEW